MLWPSHGNGARSSLLSSPFPATPPDVFGHGMMLYSECLGGRVGAEAANQRFRFDSVFKLWMLERYLQSGRPMCNQFTAALGFQPVVKSRRMLCEALATKLKQNSSLQAWLRWPFNLRLLLPCS